MSSPSALFYDEMQEPIDVLSGDKAQKPTYKLSCDKAQGLTSMAYDEFNDNESISAEAVSESSKNKDGLITIVMCKFCNKNLKIQEDESMSSFRKHLNTKHRNKVPELKKSNDDNNNKVQCVLVLDMLNNKANEKHNHELFDPKKFTDLVKKWVIKHNWSFHIVEDDVLNQYLHIWILMRKV
ncbi:24663_t:CDS:2 [Cetraspora pellucida]|uniref:24663_t:CDS:1 n=1 Tax=Cetraspora pellucida TaxID=1433469 RepID=A0A9N9HEL6_9GLOM|nr:24663_t:CDS:2 [Cetraspora pellucida]